MKVIVAGYIDFEHPNEVSEILISARPHIEGALEEEGCIAYSLENAISHLVVSL